MANDLKSQGTPREEFARAAAGFGGTNNDMLFSVTDLAHNVWRRRYLYILAVFVGVLVSIYYLANTPKIYVVGVLVGPVGDAASASGSFSLANLLGASAPTRPMSTWDRYLFTLHSVRLAEKLDKEHGMIKDVFGGRWDAEAKEWKPTAGFDAWLDRFLRGLFDLPSDPAPDIRALQQYLTGSIVIDADKESGSTTLNMSTGNPKAALDFILLAHNAAIDLIRSDISAENSEKISYLYRALERTANENQRSVLIDMLSQTEQTQMLLNNNLPFAAEILDTPIIPSLPSSPPALSSVFAYRIAVCLFLLSALIVFDQIVGTNIVGLIETGLRRAGGFVKKLFAGLFRMGAGRLGARFTSAQ